MDLIFTISYRFLVVVMVKINLTARLKERLWYELYPRSLLFMVWGGGGGGEGSIHTYLLAMYSDDVFQSLTFFSEYRQDTSNL